MITIHELLTTYWSQITLLLLGFGYILQRSLDLKSKKIEINHSLFQQKKLESINNFFGCYAKAEQMWTHLAIYDILDRKLSAQEIDYIIYPHINELRRSAMELQIFFDENDHKYFLEIVKNIETINMTLKRIYFDIDSDITSTSKIFAFQSSRDEMLKQNIALIKTLTNIAKNAFA